MPSETRGIAQNKENSFGVKPLSGLKADRAKYIGWTYTGPCENSEDALFNSKPILVLDIHVLTWAFPRCRTHDTVSDFGVLCYFKAHSYLEEGLRVKEKTQLHALVLSVPRVGLIMGQHCLPQGNCHHQGMIYLMDQDQCRCHRRWDIWISINIYLLERVNWFVNQRDEIRICSPVYNHRARHQTNASRLDVGNQATTICITVLSNSLFTNRHTIYNYYNSGHYPSSCLLSKTRRFGGWAILGHRGRSSLCLQTPAAAPRRFKKQIAETRPIYWTQLSTFHLKTETESSLRNVVF
jgi:hypothetical protein